MAVTCPHIQMLQTFRKVIPPLVFDVHKGQAGRIGIVGGCDEYTGAPIFAAMAALRTGADIVHVFCTQTASIPIKSFSPDLVVHPNLNLNSFSEEMNKWLPRIHALVIGPGLGRDTVVLENVERLIRSLRRQDKPIPLVVDADGLYLITEKPDLIKHYDNCILTPNKAEFERLYEKVTGRQVDEQQRKTNPKELAQKLAEALQVNIFMKGHFDIICSPNNQNAVQCEIDGSPRRCGGQGDLLAGALATCYYWTIRTRDQIALSAEDIDRSDSAQIAGYAASTLLRSSCQTVFNQLGRSMISADVLKEIGPTFARLFDK